MNQRSNNIRQTCLALLAGISLACFASVAGAQSQSTTTPNSASQAEGQPDLLQFVPAELQFALLLRPQQMLNHPYYKQIAEQDPQAMEGNLREFADEFGGEMDECLVLLQGELPRVETDSSSVSQPFVIAVFAGNVAKAALTEGWEQVETKNGAYWREPSDGASFPDDEFYTDVLLFPAENLVIKTRESCAAAILSGQPNKQWQSRLGDIPQDQAVTLLAGQQAIGNVAEEMQQVAETPGFPPPIAQLLPVLNKLQFVTVNISFSETELANVKLEAANAADAAELKGGVEKAVQLAQAMLMLGGGGDPALAEMTSMGIDLLNGIESKTADSNVQVTIATPDNFVERASGPLLSAVIAARSAARRTERANKMRQVAIAAHNFHDVEQKFPPGGRPNSRDANGRMHLSWRVHLLPYLEELELYRQFHFDEPWDSEHNKKLLNLMPDVYALNQDLPPGMTDVIAPFGQDTLFGDSQTKAIKDIVDGTSNTAMFFEASPEHAVPWTKPDDFKFDPDAEDAMQRFGQPDMESFIMAMADASIRNQAKSTSAEIIGWLINIRDRKPTGDWDGQ